MPTISEYIALIENTNSTWVWNYHGTGVSGALLIDNNDSLKELFFPAAGYIEDDEIIYYDSYDTYGYYWSSSANTSCEPYNSGACMYIIPEETDHTDMNRCQGHLIRGVLDDQ